MTARHLKSGRRNAGLSQADAARRLRVSQPYLSQLENGTRVPTAGLARRAKKLYDLPATALPIESKDPNLSLDDIERELGGLGYPGFAFHRGPAKTNPAQLVLIAITMDLDCRLVEGLP